MNLQELVFAVLTRIRHLPLTVLDIISCVVFSSFKVSPHVWKIREKAGAWYNLSRGVHLQFVKVFSILHFHGATSNLNQFQ